MKDLFRKEKGTLTTEQMDRVNFIKAEAQKLFEVIVDNKNEKLNSNNDESERCIEKSIERFEEAVMWAVKAYTNINK